MKNSKKMRPSHPVFIAIMVSGSLRDKCPAHKLNALFLTSLSTEGQAYWGQKGFYSRKPPKPEASPPPPVPLRGGGWGGQGQELLSLRPQSSVSFQSTTVSLSIHSANAPGWPSSAKPQA